MPRFTCQACGRSFVRRPKNVERHGTALCKYCNPAISYVELGRSGAAATYGRDLLCFVDMLPLKRDCGDAACYQNSVRGCTIGGCSRQKAVA